MVCEENKMPADNNERFCEMAAITPQTNLCGFERLSLAETLVEAATSQSRQNVPNNWELQGFGVPIYTNITYPHPQI
jgi:hypothetical protein